MIERGIPPSVETMVFQRFERGPLILRFRVRDPSLGDGAPPVEIAVTVGGRIAWQLYQELHRNKDMFPPTTK